MRVADQQGVGAGIKDGLQAGFAGLLCAFTVFARADVGQRYQHRRRIAILNVKQPTIDLHHARRTITVLQRQFAMVLGGLPAHAAQIQMPKVSTLGRDEACKRLPQKFAARCAEQGRAIQVEAGDQARVVEREIADRGELIEVNVTVTRCFQRGQRLAQSRGLHLQLDLMNLQLMQQCFRGAGGRILRR